MRTFKLVLAIIAVTFIGTMSFGSNGFNNVVIQEKTENSINLKTELDQEEHMQVIITNEEGEVIVFDEINDAPRQINKTYDFNKARIGNYTLKVIINDELIRSTVIGNEEVTFQEEYSFDIF